jgi:hypothetical protein
MFTTMGLLSKKCGQDVWAWQNAAAPAIAIIALLILLNMIIR